MTRNEEALAERGFAEIAELPAIKERNARLELLKQQEMIRLKMIMKMIAACGSDQANHIVKTMMELHAVSGSQIGLQKPDQTLGEDEGPDIISSLEKIQQEAQEHVERLNQASVTELDQIQKNAAAEKVKKMEGLKPSASAGGRA